MIRRLFSLDAAQIAARAGALPPLGDLIPDSEHLEKIEPFAERHPALNLLLRLLLDVLRQHKEASPLLARYILPTICIEIERVSALKEWDGETATQNAIRVIKNTGIHKK